MESPHGDPTTPGVAPATSCACPTAWADDVHRAGQICRKTGRQGGQPDTLSGTGRTQAAPDLASLASTAHPACLPCLPTLPRFSPYPRVSYCQRKRHTRAPQNGLLSSHFTISRFVKTLHTDTQRLTCILNIISII